MKRLILILLILYSVASNAGNQYWSCTNSTAKWSSAEDFCNAAFPSYTSGGIIHSLYSVNTVNATKKTCGEKQCQEPPGTWCGGPFGTQTCNLYTCPAGQEVDKNSGQVQCVPVCTSPQVRNPYTGQCQDVCPNEPQPPLQNASGLSVGIFKGAVCNSGCEDEYTQWFYIDSQGYEAVEQTHKKNGNMCSTGNLSEPPPIPPRSCQEPAVVRSDGTCGTPDPTCKPWEQLENHQCVDKPCENQGDTLKCGQVNGEEFCACSGPNECSPGQVKNAFGNCVVQQNCVSPQVQDSVTGLCVNPPTSQCPPGTVREGMICKPADRPQCEPPQFYIPGCGCVTSSTFVQQCASNTNDLDGDGTPNSNDDDSDGDGTPNANDGDSDNDGVPNANDATPQGPGSTQPGQPNTGPNEDLDGDTIPNNQDGDRDGDGVPNPQDATPDGNGDGNGNGNGNGNGTCDPATEQCGTGEPGAPVSLGEPFYVPKGITFSDVMGQFVTRVQTAPIVTAGAGFFEVSGISSNCPVWTIPATYISDAVTIDLQCSSQISDALRIAGTIVLLISAWIAVRIALIEG